MTTNATAPPTLRLDVREDSRGRVVAEVTAHPDLLRRTGLWRLTGPGAGPRAHLSSRTDLFGSGALGVDEFRVVDVLPAAEVSTVPQVDVGAVLLDLAQDEHGGVQLTVSGVPPRGSEDHWVTTVLTGTEARVVVSVSTSVMGRGELDSVQLVVVLPGR